MVWFNDVPAAPYDHGVAANESPPCQVGVADFAGQGNKKLSRGNSFVVAAVVLTLPFLDRPVALPVLARLWRKGGPPKTALARR